MEAVNDELTVQDVKSENASLSDSAVEGVSGGLRGSDDPRYLHTAGPSGRYIEKAEQVFKKGVDAGVSRLREDKGADIRLHSAAKEGPDKN